MSPWAKRMLVASMIAWTLLTAGAGWFATRGSSGSAAARAPSDVKHESSGAASTPAIGMTPAASSGGAAAPAATQTTAAAEPQLGSPPSDPAEAPNSASAPAATATAELVTLRAAPRHAAGTGVDNRARSLNPQGTGAPKPASTAKAVIVLDPGHGRGDPGAVHHAAGGGVDVTEAESNQHNAELIRDALAAMGYEVYLTRDGAGRGPGAPLPLQFITSDLYARVGLAKAVDADLYLAIHGNGASVPSISGPETWYCGRHEQAAANEKLASMVQQAMMDALHEYGYFPPDRGIKEDARTHHSGDFCQFVVTRETPVPAALLEFLFLSNDDDAKVLADDRAHVLMAQHVAAAIDAFMAGRR